MKCRVTLADMYADDHEVIIIHVPLPPDVSSAQVWEWLMQRDWTAYETVDFKAPYLVDFALVPE